MSISENNGGGLSFVQVGPELAIDTRYGLVVRMVNMTTPLVVIKGPNMSEEEVAYVPAMDEGLRAVGIDLSIFHSEEAKDA